GARGGRWRRRDAGGLGARRAKGEMVPRAQGAPLVAAEAGPEVRGARAQHEGDVEAALERDVGAAAGPAAGEDEAVAGAPAEPGPPGHGPGPEVLAMEHGPEVGARDRQ